MTVAPWTQTSMAQLLDLNSIRSVLVRLEDTIIFSLIERAQFSCNARTYQPCAFSNELPGWQGSWLDWILLGTEEFQGGRFCVKFSFSDSSQRKPDATKAQTNTHSVIHPTCLIRYFHRSNMSQCCTSQR